MSEALKSFCLARRQVGGRAWTSQFTGNLRAIINHPIGSLSNKPISKHYEDMLHDAYGYNGPFDLESFRLPNDRLSYFSISSCKSIRG